MKAKNACNYILSIKKGKLKRRKLERVEWFGILNCNRKSEGRNPLLINISTNIN